jgi:hypothetical protein
VEEKGNPPQSNALNVEWDPYLKPDAFKGFVTGSAVVVCYMYFESQEFLALRPHKIIFSFSSVNSQTEI